MEEEEKIDAKFIRVAILPKSRALLNKLAKMNGRSAYIYLDQVLKYFENAGFDPADLKIETTQQELKKFRNTIVSFIRTQEKDVLIPLTNKMDSAIKLLVDVSKELKPKTNGGFDNVKEQIEGKKVGGFILPASAIVESKAPISSDKPTFDFSAKFTETQIKLEKKENEVEQLKSKIKNIGSKITKNLVGNYVLNISKEEYELLFQDK